GGVDAIVVHKGIAANIDTRRLGLIIHLNASNELSPDPNRKILVCNVEEALELGADAVSIHVNIGAPSEAEMLSDLGQVSAACSDYGLPLLAMMYPRGPGIKNSNDVNVVKHAARIGAELNADVVKTNYTGTVATFSTVVKTCPVPVVIAGGPKAANEEGFLQMVYDSLAAGGRGVSIGRNVFQHRNPEAMARALVAIVHGNSSVSEALKIIGVS
ncbi:MAG: class I fructose-bisphosphate aldolase family protein, partial [Candidatus Bathyarchaeia archaeon]